MELNLGSSLQVQSFPGVHTAACDCPLQCTLSRSARKPTLRNTWVAYIADAEDGYAISN
jgi:hypothetical protein